MTYEFSGYDDWKTIPDDYYDSECPECEALKMKLEEQAAEIRGMRSLIGRVANWLYGEIEGGRIVNRRGAVGQAKCYADELDGMRRGNDNNDRIK